MLSIVIRILNIIWGQEQVYKAITNSLASPYVLPFVLEVDGFAKTIMKTRGFKSVKIARIVALRELADFSIRKGKDWVETHFCDDGRGAPLAIHQTF